jgi:hypothetical protein
MKKQKESLLLKADSDQQKYITAAHEAAHVVMAYLSDYHFLIGNVKLFQHDSGVTFVTLSKGKLSERGLNNIHDPYSNMEIVFDVIQIYYAGLEAEKILCGRNNLIIEDSYSSDDLLKIENLIAAINPPINVDKNGLQKLTATKVLKQWEAIEDVAKILLQGENGETDVVGLIDHLNYCYNRTW